ncbi:MAG: hypothetical protein HKN16_00150 [Saprospiraceae bacterium]|nr:hypothetical protein [Saprospiraceae bacterium]
MKPATVHQIKGELQLLDSKRLTEICLRLAKYKKENKELLTYMLFEAGDEQEYIKGLKEEITIQFSEMNQRNIYYAKKSIRKILRYTDRFLKYSGNKETEVEMRIFFCEQLRDLRFSLRRSTVLTNLYNRQVLKIRQALSKLHEDIQFDYQDQVPSEI